MNRARIKSIELAEEIVEALRISPFDISPCRMCGRPVVCLPDGLPFCEDCGKDIEETGIDTPPGS